MDERKLLTGRYPMLSGVILMGSGVCDRVVDMIPGRRAPFRQPAVAILQVQPVSGTVDVRLMGVQKGAGWLNNPQ